LISRISKINVVISSRKIYSTVIQNVIRCLRLVSVVISVRIPKELKEKLEELDINVSEVVREFLKEYVEEIEIKRLEEKLRRLRLHLSGKIDPTIVAKLVREDRVRK